MSNPSNEEDPMCECGHRRMMHVFKGCVFDGCPCAQFVSAEEPKPIEVIRKDWRDPQGANLLLCVLHELSPAHRTRQAVTVIEGIAVCSDCLYVVMENKNQGYNSWYLYNNALHGKI